MKKEKKLFQSVAATKMQETQDKQPKFEMQFFFFCNIFYFNFFFFCPNQKLNEKVDRTWKLYEQWSNFDLALIPLDEHLVNDFGHVLPSLNF